jgi:hypothetical protein
MFEPIVFTELMLSGMRAQRETARGRRCVYLRRTSGVPEAPGGSPRDSTRQ